MVELGAVLKGGWFPEAWDVPVGLALGVVVTGYVGDAIAGFVSQFIPAQWLNPASEIIAGLILFILGGFLGGDFSKWVRLFSFGAFAVGIADAITILLGLGGGGAALPVTVVRSSGVSGPSAAGVGGTYR